MQAVWHYSGRAAHQWPVSHHDYCGALQHRCPKYCKGVRRPVVDSMKGLIQSQGHRWIIYHLLQWLARTVMRTLIEGKSREHGSQGCMYKDLAVHARRPLLPVETPYSAEQAVATRRLLQSSSDTAAVVQVQMTGPNENATAAIAQELGSVVANSALQVRSFCLPLPGIGNTDNTQPYRPECCCPVSHGW